MIDLHTHILPGVDDGAASIEESVELARAAAAEGIVVIVATPHVREDYPTSADTMERLVGEVRQALAAARVQVDLRPGGEIALDQLGSLSRHELRRFGLGGNPDLVLVECPYSVWPPSLDAQVVGLLEAGFSVVLAHPERNPDVETRPERLRMLVDAGVAVQITAASLDGRGDRRARSVALDLVDRGLAQVLASDTHSARVRSPGLAAAAATLGDEVLARWLTRDVPAALLEGRPIPERPIGRTSASRGWRAFTRRKRATR